jgi:hypothetical protein
MQLHTDTSALQWVQNELTAKYFIGLEKVVEIRRKILRYRYLTKKLVEYHQFET